MQEKILQEYEKVKDKLSKEEFLEEIAKKIEDRRAYYRIYGEKIRGYYRDTSI